MYEIVMFHMFHIYFTFFAHLFHIFEGPEPKWRYGPSPARAPGPAQPWAAAGLALGLQKNEMNVKSMLKKCET